MSFLTRIVSGLSALLLAAAWGGCTPGQGQGDDEKEPHFALGMERVNEMDYPGAVEEFEESLEANPRSGAAHYQLAMLFEDKVPDPAAAIYHYEQYLNLDPGAPTADIIRQHIYACKQQLAQDVMPLPSTPAAQQQLEKLADQNRQLQEQVEHLNDIIKQWNAWYASQQAIARTNPAPAAPSTPEPQPQTPVVSQPQAAGQSPSPRPPAGGGAAARGAPVAAHTHVVASGETAMRIARKAGVSFSALQAANPGVNLSRIRSGQVLNLPPP